MEIIPAILPKNYEDLKNKVSLVKGLVSTVQIDICDGNFVKTVSWPFSSRVESRDNLELDQYAQDILSEREGMPFWEEVDYELDLMVSNAHENFELFLKLGAKRLIFHLEAETLPINTDEKRIDPDKLQEFKEFLEGIDLYIRDNTQIGIAINTSTSILNLKSLISNIDFVQCMGIEKIGYQGQPFDERVIDQVKALRKEYPELIISVDGGVSFDTAPRLIEACANRLVVGSVIFNSLDIRETVLALRSLARPA